MWGSPVRLSSQALQAVDVRTEIRTEAALVRGRLQLAGLGEEAAGRRAFVALHHRRGDMWRWRNRRHAWPDLAAVAQQVATAAAQEGVRVVFVLSDAPDSELDSLAAQLPAGLELVHARGEASSAGRRAAAVDQLVAASARFFLGNFWSSFSGAVLEERVRLNAPAAAAAFLAAPAVFAPPSTPQIPLAAHTARQSSLFRIDYETYSNRLVRFRLPSPPLVQRGAYGSGMARCASRQVQALRVGPVLASRRGSGAAPQAHSSPIILRRPVGRASDACCTDT